MSTMPGDPVTTGCHPDHVPVVPPMAGHHPYCSCGFRPTGRPREIPLRLIAHIDRHRP